MRFSGDTRGHAKAQIFAWDAHNRGVDVHLLAEPTKLEMLQKEYETKKESFKSEAQNSILAKYGGEEHLKAPPKSLLLAQTETYTEYSRLGKVVKGQEKSIIRSRYEEDQIINNHTTVWGSFWKDGYWGYKCCHSFVKVQYQLVNLCCSLLRRFFCRIRTVLASLVESKPKCCPLRQCLAHRSVSRKL